MFPKIGVPPNHPLKDRVFHYIHHPFWGFSPIFGTPPIACFFPGVLVLHPASFSWHQVSGTRFGHLRRSHLGLVSDLLGLSSQILDGKTPTTVGGFNLFFMFTPIWGRFSFWLIFLRWYWNHQPDYHLAWPVTQHGVYKQFVAWWAFQLWVPFPPGHEPSLHWSGVQILCGEHVQWP